MLFGGKGGGGRGGTSSVSPQEQAETQAGQEKAGRIMDRADRAISAGMKEAGKAFATPYRGPERRAHPR